MKQNSIEQQHSKAATGRGAAVIAYGLLLGGIMLPPIILAGFLLAWWWRDRSASWVASHLRHQIRTVLWALAGLLAGAAVWWLLGSSDMPAQNAWLLGYLVFTAELAWLVGRCAQGLYHLTNNTGIPAAAR